MAAWTSPSTWLGKVHWSPISEMDCEEWQAAITSFPTAGLLTTKHAAAAMRETTGKGSIIHLLSTAAHFGQPSGAAYCTAKAGLLNFARSAAMELAADNIRVNTITPCAMEHQLWTKMQKEVAEGRFQKVKNRPQYSREQFFNAIPLARFPRASDIAPRRRLPGLRRGKLRYRRRSACRWRPPFQIPFLAGFRP